MKSNLRPNIRLATNLLLVIGTFAVTLKIAPISTMYQKKNLFFRKLKFFIFFFLLPINSINYSHAHTRGSFSYPQEAINKSLKLGCEGIHKNQDKWLPCKNEKELHKYLRK